MDFSQDDLFDAIDAAVRDLLARAGDAGPAVDALEIAQSHFRIPVEMAEPDDEEPRRYGAAPPRRPNPNAIVLKFEQSAETHQALAGRAVAKRLAPGIFTKLGIVPGTEVRGAEKQLIAAILPRLLLPTRRFAAEARQAGYDLFDLKAVFPTASVETIAWRMLDVDDEASVVAIVDDGNVIARRGNRFPTTKQLTEAEAEAVRLAAATKDPARVRRGDWTARAWPVSGIPFRRIVLRAVPDGI
jgi:predicted transcriptional regulator